MDTPLTIYQILEKNQFDTGSVHQMMQASIGLRDRGHAVTIVSRADEVLEARAREHGVAFEALPLRNGSDFRSIAALQRLIRRDRVDVVHVHKGLSHTLALAATFAAPVPCFVVNRGVSFPLSIWNRAKYRSSRVDRIVTVCEDIRQVVIRSARVEPEKVSVIYAGVDLDRFDPDRWERQDFRREKGIAEDASLLMQVGVRDWKGWRELVDAFAEFRRSEPRAHLALVACHDEAERSMVLQYAADRGVESHVTPVEYRTDMARVLAAADVVIDASWDGTGITGTIREAMAMRKPVIATDCGGNRELVSSPEVGWLIPMRDTSAIVEALAAVRRDPDHALQVGRNAAAHVREHFSMERRIERLEHLYRDIVQSKATTASR